MPRIGRQILPGERFGRLTVIGDASSLGQRKVSCLCDCGNHTVASFANVFRGRTSSCGCREAGKANAIGELSHSRLKEVLLYMGDTGQFYRLHDRSWPTEVPKHVTNENHLCVPVGKKPYQAGRLAWFYVHGAWPSGMIDHIDRDPENNRIDNLRLATASENRANSKLNNNSSSGYKGAHVVKERSCYRAVCAGKHLGYFPTAAAAHEAYRRAARARFGDFATSG